MNLIKDAWIKVNDLKGNPQVLSLEELYKDSENISEVQGLPTEIISIYRLLLCITQAALAGPVDTADWKKSKIKIVKDSLSYLKKWENRFELYGTKPFLQIPSLQRTNNAPVDKLFFHLASGNNHTLFDHEALKGSRDFTDGEIAYALLAHQLFDPSGLMKSDLKWGKKAHKVSTAINSPCTSSLIGLLIGVNLLETIHMNLITKKELQNIPFGRPVWEYDLTEPDKKILKEISASYLGHMVPLSRGILIDKEKQRITRTEAVQYLQFPEYRDPMTAVISTKKDQKVVSIRSEKAIWRDLESFLRLDAQEGKGIRALHKVRNNNPTFSLYLGGLECNKASIINYAEWRTKIYEKTLGDAELNILKGFIEDSEENWSKLSKAVWIFVTNIKNISKKDKTLPKLQQQASKVYWSSLEGKIAEVLEKISSQKSIDSFVSTLLKRSAEKAFDAVCDYEGEKYLKAFVKGKSFLKGGTK
jgi:CRISPR system Cascade subunit CasA